MAYTRLRLHHLPSSLTTSTTHMRCRRQQMQASTLLRTIEQVRTNCRLIRDMGKHILKSQATIIVHQIVRACRSRTDTRHLIQQDRMDRHKTPGTTSLILRQCVLQTLRIFTSRLITQPTIHNKEVNTRILPPLRHMVGI
jgi:hypothetical protein